VELTHSFTVPASLDEAWATFMDLELVGGCFPGATVTEVTDDGFTGTVKVKLGPISLVYAGSGTFAERDDTAHRAVIEAKGKDRRGNGTAGATVTIALSEAPDGPGTLADVHTDLAITGKPAQFGRGVMQDVSDKLLGQFVACIEDRFSPDAAQRAAGETAEAGSVSAGSAAAAGSAVSGEPVSPSGPPPAPAQAPQPSQAPHLRAVPAPAKGGAGDGDALDLGSTVLPVLLRSYGKQVAAGLLVLLVVLFLAGRRRRAR
jgi:carbon monoxide dehydrogenase subunit G